MIRLGLGPGQKIRLAIPTIDIVTLPLKMIQAKGFYQKEGLEVAIILVAGALGVRVTLRGIAHYRQNRAESIRFIARELKTVDESLAAQMFDWHQTVLADEGRPSRASIDGVLDFTRRCLDLKAPIPVEQVFDFSFVEKAAR